MLCCLDPNPDCPQGGLLADEKFLPALLRAHRRAPPPPAVSATSVVTAAGGAGRLQKQGSERSRAPVEERLEEADGASTDSGSDHDHTRGEDRDERGISPAAPVVTRGHVDGEGEGGVTGTERSAQAEVGGGGEVGVGLGLNGIRDDAAREGEGEPPPSIDGESGPAGEDGAAAENLPADTARHGCSGSGSGSGIVRDGDGGGVGGIDDQGLGAADNGGVPGAGDLQDTAPPANRQQADEEPEISGSGQQGEEWGDGHGNNRLHSAPEDGSRETPVSFTEPREGTSSVKTGVAEEPPGASKADEPQPAEAAQEAGGASPPPSSDGPPWETAEDTPSAPSTEEMSRDEDAPSKEKSDGSGDDHRNGTESPPPKEDEGGPPPQAQEGEGGPKGEAATGLDHSSDENDGSSGSTGSKEGGGAPDVAAASGGADTGLDAAASGSGVREANIVRPALAAEEPFRERAASWAWMIPSWRRAGGKHH